MVRENMNNNGNGDGKVKAVADATTRVEKSLPKGGTIGMGEAGSHMAGVAIPSDSLSLDLAVKAQLGVRRSLSVYGSKERELLASCPTCKTFETLWFKGDVLIPTKRFAQGLNKRVYHDCGSLKPCRLLPKFAGEWTATTTSDNLPHYLIETSRPGAETTVCVAH